jgi:hypothetical protein
MPAVLSRGSNHGPVHVVREPRTTKEIIDFLTGGVPGGVLLLAVGWNDAWARAKQCAAYEEWPREGQQMYEFGRQMASEVASQVGAHRFFGANEWAWIEPGRPPSLLHHYLVLRANWAPIGPLSHQPADPSLVVREVNMPRRRRR